MIKRSLIALMASLAIHAQAAPVVFTSSQYTTSAVAIAESQADFQTSGSPPGSLPVSTSAVVVGTSDFAAASGLGASGLLTATSEVDSIAGVAYATGQSEFNGVLAGSGPLWLHFDFLTLTSIFGDGSDAVGSLFVTLSNTVDGTMTTLFSSVFTSDISFDLNYMLPLGGLTTLDVILVSEASTSGSAQSGQNFAQVSYYGMIPEPTTSALVVLALLAAFCLRGTNQAGRQSGLHAA